MKIWAYALVWNEEKILPYYLKYYSQFCDKIIIYDNESTDRSREIINEYPNTEIRTFHSYNTIRDDFYLNLKRSAVMESKGKVDYVIVGDVDEFLYHPDLESFLVKNQNFVFYKPAGFQMVSEKYPTTDGMIYDEVNEGVPDTKYCKPILINPNHIKDFNFAIGAHHILNVDTYNIKHKKFLRDGKIIFQYDFGQGWIEIPYNILEWEPFKHRFDSLVESPLKLLHFKYIGLDYLVERNAILASRLSEKNKERGWGKHYYNDVKKTFDELNDKKIKIL